MILHPIIDLLKRIVIALPDYAGGGSLIATGEFTLASNGQPPTIVHNLGTQRVAGVVYPTGTIVPNVGYLSWRFAFVNTSALIGPEQTFFLDFTNYNSHFSNPVELSTSNAGLWDGFSSNSPWSTQSVWQFTANGDNMISKSSCSYTDNSIAITLLRAMSAGTYKYVIIGVM